MARNNDAILKLTMFCLKLTGLSTATNHFEERCRYITLVYSVVGMLFHSWILTLDMYYCRSDFRDIQVKILLLNVLYKEHWGMMVNIGRNASDRMLLFNIQMDLPFTTSPYFEMTFLVQAFLLYQIGLCYFCFDNILCITNLHVAGQFRILQYRLENMIISDDREEHDESGHKLSLQSELKYYSIFKSNVRQHQALIAYCKMLEKVYSLFSLGQVLLFSLIICLDGYQLIMPETSAVKRFLFLFRIFSCNAQLLMFTYSCDCLIQDSANVATAMYAAPWSYMPMNNDGKMLRKELILVMMRSRVPCCLTANGFFIVSLETYTKVLSTAVSYFTLLRQRGVTTQ
ncbi:odorant receptor 13a-like [Ptiloglossa arizonensis]|uniref:odorant receptor 13a-like n=1 Tax=Ptiloglossa arizonensis TaxID=3350558 RepID=UPI003FA13F4B